MEVCAVRGLCIGNIYFKHSSLHKYTNVVRGQDGVEVKSMIDLVLVKRNIYAGCEAIERNGMRLIRSPFGTV